MHILSVEEIIRAIVDEEITRISDDLNIDMCSAANIYYDAARNNLYYSFLSDN